jgi:hypothetical protein
MTKLETAAALLAETNTLSDLSTQLREMTAEVAKSQAAVDRGGKVVADLRKKYGELRAEYIGLRSLMCALSEGKIGRAATIAAESSRLHVTG